MDVVLVNPEIPQNTGSIARTCAATETPLHIVGKPLFEISDRTVRRAGLDYWPYVDLTMHETWDKYLALRKPPKVWLFSKFGERPYYQAEFGTNDAFVFGSETKGLGQAFLDQFPPEQVLKIPMSCPGVRSINLSNAVSVAIYEGRRQLRLDEVTSADVAQFVRG